MFDSERRAPLGVTWTDPVWDANCCVSWLSWILSFSAHSSTA